MMEWVLMKKKKEEFVILKTVAKMYLKHWQCATSVYLITRGMLQIALPLHEQEANVSTENGA